MLYIVSYDKKTNTLYSSIIEHSCFVYDVRRLMELLDSANIKYKIHQKAGLLYSFEYLGWYD